MSDPVRISIVATVRNEAAGVEAWLDGLLRQTRQPDQIVIVDGGSSDGTFEAIERRAKHPASPIELVSAPCSNISQGRNLAIDHAIGEVIVVTDAGTEADEHWLERLVQPILEDGADVASGFFVPRLDTAWQRALAATDLPTISEIDPTSFLPTSRTMAFKRGWFDAGV
ncbi:MAG: glycosyltransferase, partial [Thermomicrobiales bacterium]